MDKIEKHAGTFFKHRCWNPIQEEGTTATKPVLFLVTILYWCLDLHNDCLPGNLCTYVLHGEVKYPNLQNWKINIILQFLQNNYSSAQISWTTKIMKQICDFLMV